MKNLLLILVILITGITNAQCNLEIYDECPEIAFDFECGPIDYSAEISEIEDIIAEFFVDMVAHNDNTYEGKPATRVSDDINDYDIHVDFYSFGYTDYGGQTVHCKKTGDKVLVDISINADTWHYFTSVKYTTAASYLGAGIAYGADPVQKKKWLIYHELGHAVLKLNHICEWNEIMAAPGCTHPLGGQTLTFPTHLDYLLNFEHGLTGWNQALNRMFTGTNQEYSSCTDGVITETTSSTTSSSTTSSSTSSSAAATNPSQSSAGAQPLTQTEDANAAEAAEAAKLELYGDTDLTDAQLQNRIDAIEGISDAFVTVEYGWDSGQQQYIILLSDGLSPSIISETAAIPNLTTITYLEFKDRLQWTIDWRNDFISKIADNN